MTNQQKYDAMLKAHKPGQVTISRYQLLNFGPNGFRVGAAWHWAYIVQYGSGVGLECSDRGTGLADARSYAKRMAKQLGGVPVVQSNF